MTTQTPTAALAEAWTEVTGYYCWNAADVVGVLAALRTRGYTVAPIAPATEFDIAREFLTLDEPAPCTVCGGLHKRGIECSASLPVVSCRIAGNLHSEPAQGTCTAPAVVPATEIRARVESTLNAASQAVEANREWATRTRVNWRDSGGSL